MSSSSTQKEASRAAGGSIYSLPGIVSLFFDTLVLGISNSYMWHCLTATILLPFFKDRCLAHHLDIGVGTGYYLANAEFPANASATLCDLNADSLKAANARLGETGVEAKNLLHNIEKLLPMVEEKFESISLMYLLYCMPGPPKRKAAVFDHLKRNLAEGGVLFGATILGKGAHQNWAGKTLMYLYNRKGILEIRGTGRNLLLRR